MWSIDTCIYSYHLSLWFFYVFFLFLCFSFLFFLPHFPSVPPLLFVHSYPFLYLLPWWDLPFLPLNCFWLIIGVLPGLPTGLLASQPLPLLRVCWLHHFLFLDKIDCLVFTSLRFHFTPLDLALSYHLPLRHASSGSSPYLPLLGEISFQQDISP